MSSELASWHLGRQLVSSRCPLAAAVFQCSHPIEHLTSSDPSWHTKSQRDGAAQELLESSFKVLMCAQYLLKVTHKQLWARV